MRIAALVSAALTALLLGGLAQAQERGQERERPRRAEAAEGTRAPKSMVQPPATARRGALLPDGLRGGVVSDYQRYRLRPPPAGYAWVRVGSGFALISLADGQVFDTVE